MRFSFYPCCTLCAANVLPEPLPPPVSMPGSSCTTPGQQTPSERYLQVVKPRCVWYTGHVAAGGSICTEALTLTSTPTGWQPSHTVEGILLEVGLLGLLESCVLS